MAIDREAALKKAEKLLRQGKLDAAIEEYVRLIEEQPGDWSAINTLGDLYLRAGDAGRAVAQFTRVADHLFDEGFLSKAAALYKKALKVEGTHEHTLSRLAETAARQGLLVDAKAYLRQLMGQRQRRGDEPGVTECLSRLRGLEEVVSQPAPGLSAATPVPAARDEDPGALFEQARRDLTTGDEHRARAMLTRVLTLDPARHADVVALALDLARQGRVETAFGCIDLVADGALLDGDVDRAVGAFQAFVAVVPHTGALMKLVELCVDAGLDDQMRAAQAQLDALHPDAEPMLGGSEDPPLHPETPVPVEHPETAVPVESEPVEPESVEIDLSDLLSGIGTAPAAPADDAIAQLEAAARIPGTGARAAAELGRLYIQRGELETAVEWLERAADAPTSPDEGFAVLYELADALERLGEPARALAILVELDADAGGYRDVRDRIEHLSRVQAGSPGE